MTEDRPLNEVITDFNTTTSDLIKFIEQRTKSEIDRANLDRLRRLLGLLKSNMGPEAPIKEAYPFFIEFREQILEEDVQKREQFFLTIDPIEEAKKRGKEIKKEYEFAIALTGPLKALYQHSKQKDRDAAYEKVKILFACCCEYGIANNLSI